VSRYNGWIPTARKHPSYWEKVLGGMTDQGMDSRLRGNDRGGNGGVKEAKVVTLDMYHCARITS